MPRLTEYPLQWPEGWKKTVPIARKLGHFQSSFTFAERELASVVKQIGGQTGSLIINCNHYLDELTPNEVNELTMDRYISSPEVVISFLRKNKEVIFACDKWLRLRDNLRALSCTIQALQKVSFWGAGEAMERAFNAFEVPALPSPRDWRAILGFTKPVIFTRDLIQRAWRDKIKTTHPDIGGYDGNVAEVNAARDEAFRELGF